MPKDKKSALAGAVQRLLASKPAKERARLLRRTPGESLGRQGQRLHASNSWQRWEIELLGKLPDRDLSRRIGRSYEAVQAKRHLLGIPFLNENFRPWKPAEDRLLGVVSDDEVARRLRRSMHCVPLRECSGGFSLGVLAVVVTVGPFSEENGFIAPSIRLGWRAAATAFEPQFASPPVATRNGLAQPMRIGAPGASDQLAVCHDWFPVAPSRPVGPNKISPEHS